MGEATLAELWDDFCRQKDFEDPLLVPAKKGVYCIRIPAGMEVTFKDTIDNHPGAAYPIERLEAKRVPSSGILYIWAIFIRKTHKPLFCCGHQPTASWELSSIYSAIRRNSSAYLNFTLMFPPS